MKTQHSSKSRLVPLTRFGETWWAVAVIIASGVVFIGAGAWLEVPMVPVPMSLQTYAVFVVSALAGWRLGVAVVLSYLLAAAAGAPLLAGGASGVDHLLGRTAGYLLGFVASAALVGWLAERIWFHQNLLRSSLVMLAGHCVTLVLGTAWLAKHIGMYPAIQHGLWPFLIGAIAKSILAAVTVQWLGGVLLRSRIHGKSRSPSGTRKGTPL